MKSLSLYFLLLVSAAALPLHASASQEARPREFISSRRGSVSSTDTFRVRNIADRVAGSLSAESSVSDQSSMKAADKITALPGQPEGVDFDQYGGYVTVDEANGRALFYYLAESPSGASEKPLLLWLNGGPGCSSLGFGAMQELGPFRVAEDNKTLTRNMNAWNNVANVIFLESPAGVGFSYSNTSSDYDLSGDERTADDAYVFLVKWLERFPEYKGRAFYISGESFAGHYVPELAATILFHNTYNNRTIVNLQGFLVGNPYLDEKRNIQGAIDFFWTHAVISDEVYANVTKNCDFGNWDGNVAGTACSGAWDAFDGGQIDYYDIYAPVCIHAPNGARYPSGYLPGYDPCSVYPTWAYLNDQAVQSAFHARTTKWSPCKNLHWKDAPMSMLPTLKWLIGSRLPVWIFSGDFDSVCSLPATRYSIQDLGLPVTTPWRPWTAKEEVGGYVQQYAGGFTFLSVRGAGHLVPSFQPERALVMLSSFLKGMLPPYIQEQ
ncbi:hypothetical protein CFC21_071972 [Triticum aestivum]|uniref:Carboxypeptidase n=3 Tax=Triticum TaxID=4564 RepID=A0A9R0XAW8_TRITD|nr:serine carboxypeptidase 1-like [Triticum aestivum]KAF7065907.1 hypothetical protein CFC21_071972 [Triticum aestivum]VAI33189.1 unnamed protein product [Triticum turgidum subsp. durum]